MKIKSDETPKFNQTNLWMKSKNTSEVTKTILFTVIAISILTITWFVASDWFANGLTKLRKAEADTVDKIIKFKPVINCRGRYYLPDEYELELVDGRNILDVAAKGVKANTFYLSECKLLLSKTKDTVTQNFIDALYRKRGYRGFIEVKPIVEPVEIKKDLPQQTKRERPISPKEITGSKTHNMVYDVQSSNDYTTDRDGSIHTSDFYERKEYADRYDYLVQSYYSLAEYKKTKEYKDLKLFERTPTLSQLNKNYNSVRPRMWTLHCRFGMSQGPFHELESGKLSVKMLNGVLQFGRKF